MKKPEISKLNLNNSSTKIPLKLDFDKDIEQKTRARYDIFNWENDAVYCAKDLDGLKIKNNA
jgi:hypothetical protein